MAKKKGKRVPRGREAKVVRPVELASELLPEVRKHAPSPTADAIGLVEELARSKVVSLFMADGQMLQPNLFEPLRLVLEQLRRVEKLGLFLRSTGGLTEVPWRIVTTLREFCDELQVLVPEIAMSGATHIALAADELIMGPLSTLGSVDPSRKHPLLPKTEDGKQISVSVEDFRQCIEFVRDELRSKEGEQSVDPASLARVIAELFRYVNPIGLGALLQSYQLSKLVTQKVLKSRNKPPDDEQIKLITERLASGYYSHGFFISRWDAKEDLGLETTDPSPELWKAMQDLNGWYVKQSNTPRALSVQGLPGAILRYVGFIESKSTRQLMFQVADASGNVRAGGVIGIPNKVEAKP